MIKESTTEMVVQFIFQKYVNLQILQKLYRNLTINCFLPKFSQKFMAVNSKCHYSLLILQFLVKNHETMNTSYPTCAAQK
jgi:hypothetical protein